MAEIQNRSMTDDAPGDGSGPQGKDRDGLLATNDLVYILPPDLSVSVNQTHKNQYFQSNTYTNTQRGVCILNTGADYGDLRHSTLELGIQMDAAATRAGWFGRHGSILNIIKSITISSRSGDEISRIQDFNLLSYHQNPLRYDQQWINTVGGTIGYGQYLHRKEEGNANFRTQRFSIPLYLLSDFFGYGRLMPSAVLSGLRIEIEWANPSEAFLCVNTATRAALAADGVTGYTIDNPYVSIRAVQLTDATQRTLNELSASNGLELVYCDYERTDRSLGAAGNLNMEIRKAASRALKAFVVTRVTADISGAAAFNKDSFKSLPWGYTNWQWQLGSLYYPQQPVKTTNTDTGYEICAESYKHALIAHDKFKGNNGKSAALGLYKNPSSASASRLTTGSYKINLLEAAIGFDSPYTPDRFEYKAADGTPNTLITQWQYKPGIGEEQKAVSEFGTFANGNACLAVTLERSDLFNLSGVPINNSRVLAIRADYTAGDAAGVGGQLPQATIVKSVSSFLKYVRLARVFLNNVEVEQ